MVRISIGPTPQPPNTGGNGPRIEIPKCDRAQEECCTKSKDREKLNFGVRYNEKRRAISISVK